MLKRIPSQAVCLLLIIGNVAVFSGTASAHNVLGGVYTIGDVIEGEVGFSNGDMAPEGSIVKVSDPSGQQLFALETDSEGFFTFTATQRIDHHIHVNLGAGHVYNAIIAADELPNKLGRVTDSNDGTKEAVFNTAESGRGLESAALQAMIEKAVAKQVKPVRQDLLAYKEKASFRDVLGGIGYIFGLCGVGIWIRQKQKEEREG